MKKITAVFLSAIVFFAVFLCGCSEKSMSKADYASAVVSLYGKYSDKFDEIITAISKGQRITAAELCDEAYSILDEMSELVPPVAFRDEHEDIVQYCKDEQEKLTLQKEYMDIVKDGKDIPEDKTERIEEIQQRLSELSLKSDKFYVKVAQIADKELEKQTEQEKNLLDDAYIYEEEQ